MFAGMLALIVAELALLVNVPIFTGLENEPDAFDNCAVYVLPENVPLLVKGTLTLVADVAVTHTGEFIEVLVVMDWLANVVPLMEKF